MGCDKDAAPKKAQGQLSLGSVRMVEHFNPLASRCLGKSARAVAPNGKRWTPDNIGTALASRALGQHLREIGMNTGGPAPFSKADRSRFLTALDTVVHEAQRG